MDVKSAFLNLYIKEEEVFFEQPSGFQDFEFSNHVYKLKKSLYGLNQAPRSWYERLSQFFIKSEFHRGNVDSTLFVLKSNKDLLFVQFYVDDIIFVSIISLCTNMQQEFEMSMMGELTFFLGLQI